MRKLHVDELRRANIPEAYWAGISLSQIPDTAPHKEVVVRYAKRLPDMVTTGIGIYLWSPENGTGKTAIAAYLLKRALRHGFTGFYIRTQDLKDSTVVGEKFDDFLTVARRARDVDFLVLDDFGKEYKTDSGYAEMLIEDYVRERVQRRKATCITTNLNPKNVGAEFATDLAEVMKEGFRLLRLAGVNEGGRDWRGERQDFIKKFV